MLESIIFLKFLVNPYTFFLIISAIVAFVLFMYIALAHLKISIFEACMCFFITTTSGLLISKLTSVLEFYVETPIAPWADFFDIYLGKSGNKSYLTPFLTPIVYYFMKNTKNDNFNMLSLFDVMAWSSCLGIAIGKIGCYLSGHGCYGMTCDLPICWNVPFGENSTTLPVFQTALYESILLFCLFFYFIIKQFVWKSITKGTVFINYIIFSFFLNILTIHLKYSINSPLYNFSILANFISTFLVIVLFFNLKEKESTKELRFL